MRLLASPTPPSLRQTTSRVTDTKNCCLVPTQRKGTSAPARAPAWAVCGLPATQSPWVLEHRSPFTEESWCGQLLWSPCGRSWEGTQGPEAFSCALLWKQRNDIFVSGLDEEFAARFSHLLGTAWLEVLAGSLHRCW